MDDYEDLIERRKKTARMIVACYGICLFAVVVLLVPFSNVSQTGCGCGSVSSFPTIEIELAQTETGPDITITHIQGDPLEFGRYRIIITENVDIGKKVILEDLSGLITAGDTIHITSADLPELDEMDFEPGKSYQFEFYDLKENKRVFNWEYVLCKSEI
jgi:hypothetical protein